MVRLFESPEDFRVDEEPLYAPVGEGGHTFVRIEKRDRTTEEVARWLAREGRAVFLMNGTHDDRIRSAARDAGLHPETRLGSTVERYRETV